MTRASQGGGEGRKVNIDTINYNLPRKGNGNYTHHASQENHIFAGFSENAGTGISSNSSRLHEAGLSGCDASIKQLKGLNGEELIKVIVLF